MKKDSKWNRGFDYVAFFLGNAKPGRNNGIIR